MMLKTHLRFLLMGTGVALFSLVSVVNADIIHYEHTFDGVANDSAPGLQGYSNGAGTNLFDLSTGLLGANSGNGGTGFVATGPIGDLSSFSEFTVEYVVTSSFASVENSGTNGSFFGVTTQATYGTDGSSLYNNAGGSGAPAIGLQAGPGRGSAGLDFSFDQVSGNGSFTSFTPGADPTEDGTVGYTVLVTYSNNGNSGETGVNITTVGLDTDVNEDFVAASDYTTFVSQNLSPNVSTQNGTIDLESIRVFTAQAVPEPSSFCLLAGVVLGMVSRRRRNS